MKQLLLILSVIILTGCNKNNISPGGNSSGLTGEILFSRLYLTISNPHEIYSLDAATGKERQLTNYSSNGSQSKSSDFPSWNYNKTKFVFASQKELTQTATQLQIYSANADGTEVVRLTNGTTNSYSPKYSPDDKKVAFIKSFFSNRNDVSELYLINNDGSNETKLSDFSNSGTLFNGIKGFCWRDNDKILFTSNKDRSNNIYEINLSTLAVTRITNNLNIEGDLDISPDRSKILYSYNYELNMVNSDGTGMQKLNLTATNGAAYGAYDGSWTSDGRILFISQKDNQLGEIYIANADGTGLIRLTNNDKPERTPRIR